MSDSKAILEKLEKMDSRLDNIDITLAKQAKDLEYHIKRTDLLEDKLIPVEKHVSLVNTAFKVLLGLGTFIGFIVGIYSALK